MIIGVLGPIVFEVSADKVRTWQDVRRSATSRWATHEVYAGKPKKEFIGPGLARLDLTVRLDSQLGIVPSDELKQMRQQMDTGAVLQFTLGGARGELIGKFSIENMNERWLRTSSGVLAAIVDITLEEYQ